MTVAVWHRLIGSHQVNKTRVLDEAVWSRILSLREEVNEASDLVSMVSLYGRDSLI